MNNIYIFLAIFFISFILNGCATVSSFLKPNTKEGYLTLVKINSNIAKQIPLKKRVGSNEIKIVSVNVYASKNENLVAKSEFIFTSFEIPEGLPAVVKFDTSLKYNTKTQLFTLDNIKLNNVQFLKENLVEFIPPQQKRFILDIIIDEIKELILYRSKKRLKTIKSFKVKEGKIDIIFN